MHYAPSNGQASRHTRMLIVLRCLLPPIVLCDFRDFLRFIAMYLTRHITCLPLQEAARSGLHLICTVQAIKSARTWKTQRATAFLSPQIEARSLRAHAANAKGAFHSLHLAPLAFIPPARSSLSAVQCTYGREHPKARTHRSRPARPCTGGPRMQPVRRRFLRHANGARLQGKGAHHVQPQRRSERGPRRPFPTIALARTPACHRAQPGMRSTTTLRLTHGGDIAALCQCFAISRSDMGSVRIDSAMHRGNTMHMCAISVQRDTHGGDIAARNAKTAAMWDEFR